MNLYRFLVFQAPRRKNEALSCVLRRFPDGGNGFILGEVYITEIIVGGIFCVKYAKIIYSCYSRLGGNMNVSELFELTHWIDNEIVEKKVVQKYQTLFTILQKNVQVNQPKQPFEDSKKDLIKTIINVPLHRITKDQLLFLAKLEIAQAVGKPGVGTLEDILFRNVIDVATSAQKIQKIVKNLQNGIAKSNQIKSGLKDCIVEGEYKDDEILMRIIFSGNAKIDNISDFKSWGITWFDIGRGITMANNSSPEAIKIVGATNGSVILETIIDPKLVMTFSAILWGALKVTEHVLRIRQEVEKLRGFQLENAKIAQDLEIEAEKKKKEGVFFFKQKTAYEIKECDWSSDVCSSDLNQYNGLYSSHSSSFSRWNIRFFHGVV